MIMQMQEVLTQVPLIISCFIFFWIFPKRKYGFLGYIVFMLLQIILVNFQHGGWADGKKWIIPWVFHYVLVLAQMYVCNQLKNIKAAYIGTIAYNISFLFFQITNMSAIIFHVENDVANLLLQAAVLGTSGIIVYVIMKHIYQKEECLEIGKKQLAIAILLLIPFHIFNNYCATMIGFRPDFVTCALQILVSLSYLFVIILQEKQMVQNRNIAEKAILENLLAKQEQQYELSKQNISIINQKCHDLKHQILCIKKNLKSEKHMEYLDEIVENIQMYDSFVDTGNEVINTIFREKSLVCRHDGIAITSIIEGKAISFMDDIDICNIFGNALDNAIESVQNEADVEKRFIHISLCEKKPVLIIQFENYCKSDYQLDDSFPQTSKGDTINHGYGLKSIQYTVKKYDGVMKIQNKRNEFILTIMIPLVKNV